jgi:uncharacterized protein (TIGR01777 family)
LTALLTASGHRVIRLTRKGAPKKHDDDPRESGSWDPATGEIAVDPGEVRVVVHLAGENIAGGRWTKSRKRLIRDSRVDSTRRLCESLAQWPTRPEVFVCASAIGYYGSRGDEILTEDSPPGEGFLPEVCREWEAATQPAVEAGIRVVRIRTGLVLSGKGGALTKMLTPFRLGLGGVVGSGNQYWSWIAIDDLVSAVRHAILTPGLAGPVNGTAPNPATNREFTKVLGRILRRPTAFPLPAFAARIMLGEMADDLLLASARVVPTRLLNSGFAFQFPELEPALRHVLAAH